MSLDKREAEPGLSVRRNAEEQPLATSGNSGSGDRFNAHEQHILTGSGNQFPRAQFWGPVTFGQSHAPRSSPPTRYCIIPFPPNKDVVVRSGIFDELARLLPPSGGCQSAALWGLGGSGKTQVALEYAWRRASDPTCSVFWVHADNEATFTQDYGEIAKTLGIVGPQGEDLLAAVRRRIEAEPRWVLVLDNADDVELFGVGQAAAQASLLGFVPRGPDGTVLWTSRDEEVGSLVGRQRAVNIDRMTGDEAMTLLEKNKAVGDERDDARVLLAELERLPLAISQAAAYMRRMKMSIKEYLSRLQDSRRRWKTLETSQFDPYRRRQVPNSILETWAISIEQIRRESSAAYNILHVQAYLDNENIPLELVQKAAMAGREGGDNEEVLLAAARLQEFSFFTVRVDGRVYDMHKLVQEAARYSLSRKGGEAYFSRVACRVMANLFPEPRRELWAQAERYLVHAQRVGEWAELWDGVEEASALLTRVSDYLFDQGRWREKEPVDARAYELREGKLGDRHPDTIWSMANLAVTYNEQGRYDKAEKIRVEVLALRREVLGERHSDTIWSMADFAIIYYAQGKDSEAGKILVEVLVLQRKVLGERHADTIRSIADLATIYYTQGKYNKDKKISVKVLAL